MYIYIFLMIYMSISRSLMRMVACLCYFFVCLKKHDKIELDFTSGTQDGPGYDGWAQRYDGRNHSMR